MRPFGLSCSIPDWAYGTMPEGTFSAEVPCLTNEEMRAQHPAIWDELEAYLAQVRTAEYGYSDDPSSDEYWGGDVSVNPSAGDGNDSSFFVRLAPDGSVDGVFW